MRRFLFLTVLAAVTVSILGILGDGGGRADANLSIDPVSPGRVLILGPTVSGSPSLEETKALLVPGVTAVDVVASFAGITATTGAPFDATKGFEAYRAIILGDPTCTNIPPSAAQTNTPVWQNVVREDNGNTVIIGSDPVFHQTQGGDQLTESGIAFAAEDTDKTGAYITLSCHGDGAAAFTDVPFLDGLSTAPKSPALPDPGLPGGFTMVSAACYNDVRIVATHPALAGLTSGDLSNWSCSIHETIDSYPTDFIELAIAWQNIPAEPPEGLPYILARGEGLAPSGGPGGTPNAVGGIAELRADGSDSASEYDSGSSASGYAAIAGLAVAAGVALAIAGWYARRRWQQ